MGNSIVITKLTAIETAEIDKAAERLGCSVQDVLIVSALKLARKINPVNHKVPKDVARAVKEMKKR